LTVLELMAAWLHVNLHTWSTATPATASVLDELALDGAALVAEVGQEAEPLDDQRRRVPSPGARDGDAGLGDPDRIMLHESSSQAMSVMCVLY
jgi:hypothetical protein